jgi:hypothetical protein
LSTNEYFQEQIDYICFCFQIDSTVISLMSDEQLSSYVTAFGDRVTVRKFVDQTLKGACGSRGGGGGALSPLMERLRGKIAERTKKRKQCFAFSAANEDDSRGQKLVGNDNAKKAVRRIELGWMHYEGSAFKQIRSQNGGGVRHLKDICKTTTPEEVLATGVNLFFPNGVSKKGKVEDFDFDVRDVNDTVLQRCSIGELYENKKVKMLRLYICSKLKVPLKSTNKKPAKKLLIASDVVSFTNM